MKPETRLKQLRERALKGDAWARNYLLFRVRGEPFRTTEWQLKWLELFESNRRVIIQAPPESGKTTMVLSWILAEFAKNPNKCGAIICNRLSTAQRRMGVLQEMIELSPGVHFLWPHLKKETRAGRRQKWDSFGMILERSEFLPDFSLQACAREGPIEGSRLDFIVLDDAVDFINSYTETVRKRFIDWLLSTVFPRIREDGKIIDIGTPFHPEDAHTVLEEHGFTLYKFPAMTKDGTLKMPEIFGRQRLERKRKELGIREFTRQYLLDLTITESGIFRPEDIRWCFVKGMPFPVPIEQVKAERVYTGVDLAVKTGVKHDKTVFFTIAVDSEGVRTVLDIEVGRWRFGQITEKFLEIQSRYPMTIFCVEDIGAQDYIIQHLRDKTAIRIRAISPNKYKHSKVTGVPAMSIDFENRKWRIPHHRLTRQWMHELLSYTPEGHTGDIVAASWMADQVARQTKRFRISTI